ncbi:MAG: medium chain dehydrogenase/reductase family protein [Planctomycetes bacterium]|nr:medium chain dehydrogenase/reductase family protein [Planctomycetota bacterium]
MSYKKIVINEFGGPDVMKIVEEQQLPEPMDDEVRIKVLATSASFTDRTIRCGKYPMLKDKPPFTPGYDLVGEVDKLGKSTNKFKLGQRVAELTVTGAYTQYICLPESRLVVVPDEVDSAEAVSLILSYMTAYQMLHRFAQVGKNQIILVHGAGGAVGTAMLQLGKLLELKMFGSASKSKQELIENLDATWIDYKTQDFVEVVSNSFPEGIHAAFDPIGGSNYKKSFKTLRKKGALVAYGFYNAAIGKGGNVPMVLMHLLLMKLLPNGRKAMFYNIASLRNKRPDWFEHDLNELFKLLADNKIKPVIEKRLPLSDAAYAHKLVESGLVKGKIILFPQE